METDEFAEEFISHFKSLGDRSGSSSQNSELSDELQTLENSVMDNQPLDEPITIREIKSVIYKLKNGKATGLDMISNELIKALSSEMLPS